MSVKDGEVVSSWLACDECHHSWACAGRAYLSYSSIQFIKVHSAVQACPLCGNARNLRIISNDHTKLEVRTMASFEYSMEYVLGNEGGYTVDSGGPTNWGITFRDVAKFREVPESSITEWDMQQLTKVEAEAIYRVMYWGPLQLGRITDQGIATCILDMGVNRGISVGAKYAQRTCNMLGGALVCDGVMGLRTITEINTMSRSEFIRTFENLAVAGYEAVLAHHYPHYEIYRQGWMNRARRLFTLI